MKRKADRGLFRKNRLLGWLTGLAACMMISLGLTAALADIQGNETDQVGSLRINGSKEIDGILYLEYAGGFSGSGQPNAKIDIILADFEKVEIQADENGAWTTEMLPEMRVQEGDKVIFVQARETNTGETNRMIEESIQAVIESVSSQEEIVQAAKPGQETETEAVIENEIQVSSEEIGRIVVTTPQEFKTALADPAINYVELGADIDLADTPVVHIDASRESLIIDGNDFKLKEYYRETDSANGIVISTPTRNGNTLTELTVRNMDITGYNWWGVFQIPHFGRSPGGRDCARIDDFTLIYENVNYLGPQMVHNSRGTVIFQDCQVTLQNQRAETGIGRDYCGEVAEIDTVIIRGTKTTLVKKHSAGSTDAIFWRSEATSTDGVTFIVESGECVVDNQNSNPGVSPFIYMSNPLQDSITIQDGAKFSYHGYYNFGRNHNGQFKNISVGKEAHFKVNLKGNSGDSDAVGRAAVCTQNLQVSPGAVFSINADDYTRGSGLASWYSGGSAEYQIDAPKDFFIRTGDNAQALRGINTASFTKYNAARLVSADFWTKNNQYEISPNRGDYAYFKNSEDDLSSHFTLQGKLNAQAFTEFHHTAPVYQYPNSGNNDTIFPVTNASIVHLQGYAEYQVLVEYVAEETYEPRADSYFEEHVPRGSYLTYEAEVIPGYVAYEAEVMMGNEVITDKTVIDMDEETGAYHSVSVALYLSDDLNIKFIYTEDEDGDKVPDKEQSKKPIINDVYERFTKEITGQGVPGAEAEVVFPDGSKLKSAVNEAGIWLVRIPDEIYLEEGSYVKVRQQEKEKAYPSTWVQTMVKGIYTVTISYTDIAGNPMAELETVYEYYQKDSDPVTLEREYAAPSAAGYAAFDVEVIMGEDNLSEDEAVVTKNYSYDETTGTAVYETKVKITLQDDVEINFVYDIDGDFGLAMPELIDFGIREIAAEDKLYQIEKAMKITAGSPQDMSEWGIVDHRHTKEQLRLTLRVISGYAKESDPNQKLLDSLVYYDSNGVEKVLGKTATEIYSGKISDGQVNGYVNNNLFNLPGWWEGNTGEYHGIYTKITKVQFGSILAGEPYTARMKWELGAVVANE